MARMVDGKPLLVAAPADCCGCGACAAACPKGAIAMKEDPRGFVYPEVDESLCVGCGACVKSCGFQAKVGAVSQGPFYAACGKGDVSKSASGGVFATLARVVLADGGCAFGAAYECRADGLYVCHRIAEDEEGLAGLLNSKYVQSDAGCCFRDVRAQLKTGRMVLFCGTPCQVAGLKSFLGRDWPNLITADLVCHGVPSGAMLRGCLNEHGVRCGKTVIDLVFRSKNEGWGHSSLLLRLKDGECTSARAGEFPYYDMFMKLKTVRDSCFSCCYASRRRPGDLTLGDFWDVKKNRPDILEADGFDLRRGISCLFANNAQGQTALTKYGEGLVLVEATFDEIAKGNDQLRHPSVLPADRELYLSAFERGGWSAIERLYMRRERGMVYKAKQAAKRVLPAGAVAVLKKVAKRGN